MLYGLFVPRTIRTLDYSYYGWTIRTLDDSYDGLFVRWTIRTMDFSYYGLFVPYVKYSHIICWCEKALTLQAVCQMQVDLGARLVICMCSCVNQLLLVYYFIFLVFVFYRLPVGLDYTCC